MITATIVAKDIKEKWFIVDAAGVTLGKLSSKVAHLLRGKNLAKFSPHVNFQQKVVIINAAKVNVTGKKMDDKIYYHHTGYIGNLKQISLGNLMKKHPCRAIEYAIKGMLPHNRLGRALFRNVFVYADETHKHSAQKPEAYAI